MKNFIIAVSLLAFVLVLVIANAFASTAAAEEIEEAVKLIGGTATEHTAKRIEHAISITEDKRTVLHLGIRHTLIDSLVLSLEEAKGYCQKGDAASMNAAVASARYKISRLKNAEKLSFYNVL